MVGLSAGRLVPIRYLFNSNPDSEFMRLVKKFRAKEKYTGIRNEPAEEGIPNKATGEAIQNDPTKDGILNDATNVTVQKKKKNSKKGRGEICS